MRRVLPLVAAVAFGACSPAAPRRAEPAAPPPAAEFLLAAGDSTYWVTSGAAGARVRGAPLTLARYGGRFYEVYVGDDDRSFYDAVFVGQRIFRRDLLAGDSLQVYVDSGVAAAARRYGAAHPDEDPLGDDEDGSDDPRSALTAEVDILDSHGPYLSYAVRTSREWRGQVESAATRRGVLDLRSGRRLRVADVFGGRAGARVVAEGRRQFAAALDSVRAARDDRARLARRALGQFVFDPTSFALLDVERAPAVAFVAPGTGSEAGGYTLPLPPITVDPSPAWWGELRDALPVADAVAPADGAPAADAAPAVAERWRRDSTEVVTRYDSASGDFAVLLRRPAAGAPAHEWTVGRVHEPVHQIYWLDAPTVDSAVRRALARAFDDAALYSDEARTVAWERSQLRARARRGGSRVQGPGSSLRSRSHASRGRQDPGPGTLHPRSTS